MLLSPRAKKRQIGSPFLTAPFKCDVVVLKKKQLTNGTGEDGARIVR